MPIVLVDDTEDRRELHIGDGVIYYTRASGEEVERELNRTIDATGRPDTVRAGSTLMVAHTVGWTDGLIEDSQGNVVPFSPDVVPKVIAALPYPMRLRLDAAICRGWREAQESGKD